MHLLPSDYLIRKRWEPGVGGEYEDSGGRKSLDVSLGNNNIPNRNGVPSVPGGTSADAAHSDGHRVLEGLRQACRPMLWTGRACLDPRWVRMTAC